MKRRLDSLDSIPLLVATPFIEARNRDAETNPMNRITTSGRAHQVQNSPTTSLSLRLVSFPSTSVAITTLTERTLPSAIRKLQMPV